MQIRDKTKQNLDFIQNYHFFETSKRVFSGFFIQPAVA